MIVVTELQFNALIAKTRVRPKTREALKACMVGGLAPAVAARTYGVSRPGLYAAYSAMFRDQSETEITAVVVNVPTRHLEEFNVQVRYQMRLWSDEQTALALQARDAELNGPFAPAPSLATPLPATDSFDLT